MISLSLDLKIMISGHIIFGQKKDLGENMISKADIKSMLKYGFEKRFYV
jgi:hypothetical protein